MSWEDFCAARLLIAEERVGVAVRDAQRGEDEQYARSVAGLRRKP